MMASGRLGGISIVPERLRLSVALADGQAALHTPRPAIWHSGAMGPAMSAEGRREHGCAQTRAPGCGGGRRGFTIVEILVSLLILAMVVALLLSSLAEGRRREARVDFQTWAVQTATRVGDCLGADFADLAPPPGPPPGHLEGGAVTFERIDESVATDLGSPPIDEGFRPRTSVVTYRFDTFTHHLLRNGIPAAAGRFHDVRFIFDAGRDRGTQLRMETELWPEEDLDRPGPPAHVLRLAFTFRAPQGTLACVHDAWLAAAGSAAAGTSAAPLPPPLVDPAPR